MDFWQGLLGGFGNSFSTTYKHALDQGNKDRDYELAKKKVEEDIAYKNLLKPYYESQAKLGDAKAKEALYKIDLMENVTKNPPKSLFDTNSPDAPIKPTSLIGGQNPVWAKEESGNNPAAVNPTDGKSASFGLLQANAPATQEAMFRKSGLKWTNEDGTTSSWLPDVPVTDPKFHQAFKDLVNQDPSRHANAQMEVAKDFYSNPIAEKAKTLGLDINDGRLKDAITSAAIQHGVKGASDILDIAKANGDYSSTESAIDSIYRARSAVNPKFADRYDRERQTLLGMGKQPQTAAVSPNGSFDVAANNSMTDGSNALRSQPESGPVIPEAPANDFKSRAEQYTRTNGQLSKFSTEQLQSIVAKGYNDAARYKTAGIDYPLAGEVKLVEQELQQRAALESAQAQRAMTQKPQSMIDMQTGNIVAMTPLELSNADPNRFREYNPNTQALPTRLQQREEIISSKIDQIINDPRNAQHFENKSGDERTRIALGTLMRDKSFSSLVNSYQQDLRDYRSKVSVEDKDEKGNKIIVEPQYSPRTEQTAADMTSVQQYDKVGHASVKDAYGFLSNGIQTKQAEYMNSGLDEQTAYAKARQDVWSSTEGQNALSVLNKAYNGDMSSPVKSGRISTVGSKTMTKAEEKTLDELQKSVHTFDNVNSSLKDVLMSQDEKMSGNIISDDEMIKRATKKVDVYTKLGAKSIDVMSNFFQTGNPDVLKNNGIDNDTIRMYQNLREYFAQKRHDLTGAVFSPQESEYYAKTFASAESSPAALEGALKNMTMKNKLAKDKLEHVKKFGIDAYDPNEGLKRVYGNPVAPSSDGNNQAPLAPSHQSQGRSYMRIN
ncbi:hypothetical protein [Fundidesulfovibrio putealis]|uniref:hypothetical protein n=1 Tax=Fundidesulfovibrio putealis TaxID=270496 RepID=UPI0003F5FA90|nr:hypothetical protein [Fundidesulfovibrio putealis]